MANSMYEVMHPVDRDPRFPHAPLDWSTAVAESLAGQEGIDLGADHWTALAAVQEFFAKNESPNVRQLHDALDERFHAQGGIRYLYQLFPGGPTAQGCRLAGLTPPAGAADASFGSVK
jgi:tRNA 2-thiouridine synthesizing protein E